MMYSVKYKSKGQIFWKKLKVKGDGLLETGTHRWFVLEDESRVEVPLQSTEFVFCSKRFYAAKKQMELEAGQALVTH